MKLKRKSKKNAFYFFKNVKIQQKFKVKKEKL